MKTVANLLIGLGLLLITAYFIIGIKNGADFVHPPFVMFPAGVVCLLGGGVARFILPRI